MQDQVDVFIEWTGQNEEIRWEQWWVARHGHTRATLPTFDDYLGFIDYDLTINGLPRLSRVDGRIAIRRVRRDSLDLVRDIVESHGFRVV
jgi:hypothetical protein